MKPHFSSVGCRELTTSAMDGTGRIYGRRFQVAVAGADPNGGNDFLDWVAVSGGGQVHLLKNGDLPLVKDGNVDTLIDRSRTK